MKSGHLLKALVLCGSLYSFLSYASSPGQAEELDIAAISAAAGVDATEAPDKVVRISWPRTDVSVTVDGIGLKPFAGLGSWAAFKSSPHGAMMMGDTVVFEDEVNPAMDAAFAAGLDVTGLHNHFFFDEPKVYFMHIGGTGNAEVLAKGVKFVWDKIKDIRAKKPSPSKSFDHKIIPTGVVKAASLEAIIGSKSESKDGIVKFTIGKTGKMHGVEVGASMGLSTWIAFSGNDQEAAISGDFIMTATEVQPVLRSLRAKGINIVALHNHMTGEQPAFYFTHFWGKGSPEELAKAFKAALDEQAKVTIKSH
jgi:hypothetical protein